ncbi:uncharacterized protein [Cicer arietinum]|uniref:Uncharacterized protein LOC101499397 n=1 Tax=Cicer arietinum TaxID=3827 RepID=A0A1S2YD40_CICAR|nr:uncharacterized protein LOC101499397 [Cicer arietinum]
MAGICAVLIVICMMPSVLVVAGDASSAAIRLPSEVSGEVNNVCAGAGAEAWCPVKCFRTDPVCGVDGVTYWCGCEEAACAGVKVGKMGYCEVGNGGLAPISAQALLLVHIVWLIVLAFSVFFGLF